MDLLRAVKRSLFYAQKGYSLSSLPFVFLAYASSIYYLAVQNVPQIYLIFPRFTLFLAFSAVTLPLLCIFVGYTFMKRSPLFHTEVQVQTESNRINAHFLHHLFDMQLKIAKRLGEKPTKEYMQQYLYWRNLDNKLGWKPEVGDVNG